MRLTFGPKSQICSDFGVGEALVDQFCHLSWRSVRSRSRYSCDRPRSALPGTLLDLAFSGSFQTMKPFCPASGQQKGVSPIPAVRGEMQAAGHALTLIAVVSLCGDLSGSFRVRGLPVAGTSFGVWKGSSIGST